MSVRATVGPRLNSYKRALDEAVAEGGFGVNSADRLLDLYTNESLVLTTDGAKLATRPINDTALGTWIPYLRQQERSGNNVDGSVKSSDDIAIAVVGSGVI